MTNLPLFHRMELNSNFIIGTYLYFVFCNLIVSILFRLKLLRNK